jgi:hypothetical protein
LNALPDSTPPSPRRAPRGLGLLLLLLGLLLGLAQPALADPVTGILKVSSSVPGAHVTIDSEDVGTTPLTRYLEVGPHQIRVVLDHYDPFVRRVEITRDTTTRVEATLTPGKGTVEFAVQVPGARLFIDDKDMGPTPIRLRDLKPGTHAWRITAPRHEDASGTFEFQTGRNLFFAPKITTSQGIFVVTSEPPGAAVFLDGVQVGVTPWRGEGIAPAVHHLRLLLDDHATQIRRVDTSDGSRGEVQARFIKGGATLKILTNHEKATIFVNDDPIGQGRSLVLSPLDRGSYGIRVEASGFVTATRDISVPDSGRVILRAYLRPDTDPSASVIVDVRPLVQRWTFWAATGGLAAGSVAGGVVLARALAPEPPPEGDLLVVLP